MATLAIMTVGGAGLAMSDRSQRLIDLDRYVLTFDENFDSLSVSPWGPGTRWIAHTPWRGDFGDAAFADPEPDFPFTVSSGMLRIEARKDEERWRSGLLASADADGAGFSQQFGYFEMRAKLPAGEGLWPAFWLVGIDRSVVTAEIDVMEYYGSMPEMFESAVHTWYQEPSKHDVVSSRTPVAKASLSDDFHTYGVSIDAQTIRFYLDRREVFSTPTPETHKQPMLLLVDLGLGAGWPIENAPSPSFMYVDYIRAYRLKDE